MRRTLALFLVGGCQSATPPVAERSPDRGVCAELEEPRSRDHVRAIGSPPGATDPFRHAEAFVDAMDLEPGMRVADVGAGLGFLSLPIAQRIGPWGRVVATDVDDVALAGLCELSRGQPNLEARRARPDAVGLEPGAYDRILLSQVDHFLPDRDAFLRQLSTALAPQGRIIASHTLALEEPLLEAAARAGLEVERRTTLGDFYVATLRRSG